MPHPLHALLSAGALFGGLAGKRPSNLGVKDGRLAKTRRSPNNVSSQAEDPKKKVEPYPFMGDLAATKANIKAAIQSMGDAAVVTETPNYLHVEFTSRMLGFVDDFELYFDEAARAVHVRSASRLGYSDMGANRKRVEALRARI